MIRNYLYDVPALIDDDIRLHVGVNLCDQVNLLLYALDYDIDY